VVDLLADGKDPENQWRRTFPSGEVTLGRSSTKNTWGVGWDPRISRMCATLIWQDDRLHVRKDPEASSPIFYRGEPSTTFSIALNETFVIGDTTFTLLPSEPSPGVTAPSDEVIELVYTRKELENVNYMATDDRLEVLASLPEMIRYSPSEQEMAARVVDVLLRGLSCADVVAIIRLAPDDRGEGPTVEVPYWKARDGRTSFQPSRRLASNVISRRRQCTLHIWQSGEVREAFTAPLHTGWAVCAPLPDEPQPGWALYVAGRNLPAGVIAHSGSSEEKLKGDIKFIELVADIFASLRQVCYLQHRQAHLARFLSRPVLAALSNKNIDEVLRPRQSEVTVLFCDMRGSCRIADEANDLNALWDRVSEALTIMTSSILDQDGVIGDFQGDATMGFWGWPLECGDEAERAARAALTILRRFMRSAQQTNSPLAGFQVGLGIASGPAIAGRIGTHDQYKVGVFGPIVNLASRLESMTKLLRVPILLDERTAQRLNSGQHGHWARCRRLARLRPYGMMNAVTVSELIPAFEPGEASERHYRDYEAALDAFLEGDWATASKLLKRVPQDNASMLLTKFMERHDNDPPTTWDGVIPLESK
jgi:adenylate cyclase